MQTNIAYIKAQTSLDELAAQWLDAKRQETEANALRLQIETEIIAQVGAREEGAKTVTLDSGVKITTTGKLTYKTEMTLFEATCTALPEDLRPIKTVRQIDETGVRWLRANRPMEYALIAPALTITPAKTAVSVKGV